MPATACRLCPRGCSVDRSVRRGACGELATVRLARAALHFWEEPPVSGNSGSGTVFFTGCPLRCAYCQNASIACGDVGREVSVQRLAEIFLEQQSRGALNLNLVTATQFAPQVVEALELARSGAASTSGERLVLPVVWNTSGYENAEALRLLEGYVDVFLTDFKYASAALAGRYSQAPDYPEVASAALDAMYAQVGPYTLGGDPRPAEHRTHDEDEVCVRGVIVRHLVLPGHLDDSRAVMRAIASKPYADGLCVSLMSQYTPPAGIGKRFPELAAPVDGGEYGGLVDYALELGLENSFMQEGGAVGESFIPAFDYEGVDPSTGRLGTGKRE